MARTKPAAKPKDNEMSKRIIRTAGIIFALHVLLASALILLEYGEYSVALMSATAPVYLAIVAGYYGKAGAENIQKIKHLTDELSDKNVNATIYYK